MTDKILNYKITPPKTSTDIKKYFYSKTHPKSLQIKLHVPNLYLWVTIKGKCTFRFKLYINGKFSWVTIGHHPLMTFGSAVAAAAILQNKRDAGIHPNREKKELARQNILFLEFVNDYEQIDLKLNTRAESTQKYNMYMLGVIRDKLGAFKLKELNAEIIYSKLIKSYVDDEKMAMANRFKIKLRQIFQLAVKKELLNKNPADNLDNYYSSSNAHERNLYLSFVELREFLADLFNAPISNHNKYYILLILLLGLRKSELASAKWDMFDFEGNIFNNYQIKTKKINKLPMSDAVVKLVLRLNEKSIDDYLVVNTTTVGKNIMLHHAYFNKILDGLNFNLSRDRVDRISPHDLRRALSHLANESEKFPSIDVEMVLGHDVRTSIEKHYNNSTNYLTRKREVLNWWSEKVMSLISPEIDVFNLPLDY